MADEKYTFEQARLRLEEIAAEVRKKDTSLEKSLDLLEEGVRLANICTELVDHPDVSASVPVPVTGETADADVEASGADAETADRTVAADISTPDDGADVGSREQDRPTPEDAALEVTDDGFDADGFDDVEEPSFAVSEEETQD